MARLSTYKCDECGALKKETNGWWLVDPVPGAIVVRIWNHPQLDDMKHLCGIECTQRFIARWMGEQGHERQV